MWSWLIWIHLLYVIILLLLVRKWQTKNIYQQLQPIEPQQEDTTIGDSSSSSSATYHTTVRSPKRTPFIHLQHRFAIVIQIICIILASVACLRVQDAATYELQQSGLLQSSSSYRHATRGGGIVMDGVRHPRQDASDLIPKQRGGTKTVQEIMEQDVAHLRKNKNKKNKQHEDHKLDEIVQPTPVEMDVKEFRLPSNTATAAPALLFHLISLPFCLIHLVLYSSWSWIDPRPGVPIPTTHFIRPRLKALFQAITGTAYLMQLCMMLTMYCFLSTDLHGDAEVSDKLGVHPSGLITGLFYLPFFLFHGLRFAMNAIFLWKFRLIFPQIASSTEQLLKQQERRNKKGMKVKDSKKNKPSSIPTMATSSTTSDTSLTTTKRIRTTSTTVTSANSSTLPSDRDDDTGDDIDDTDGFDMVMLQELASFAPPTDSSADSSASSSSIDSTSLETAFAQLAPSTVMQQLRRTPKLVELLEAEQKATDKQRKKQ